MSLLYRQLAERMRGELPDLVRAFQRAAQTWERMREMAPEEQDIYLDSVALNLHSFYSGLERLFELISQHVDQVSLAGETWHRDLLWRMAGEVADARPAVISRQSVEALDELRRFRHLVRHVYAVDLEAEKIGDLMSALPERWRLLQAELRAFAEFLEEVAGDDSE